MWGVTSLRATSSHLDLEANVGEGRSPKEIKSPFSPSTSSITPPRRSIQMKSKPSQLPEQELIMVALRLAVLEKAASGIGVLAFVWATVVLLGGFVSSLHATDFWVITALLLSEGTRVFSRSHELEWQQAAPRISIGARAKSIISHTKSIIFRSELTLPETPERTDGADGKGNQRARDKIYFVPYASFLTADRVSSLLYYMQLVSALVCVGLSAIRLAIPKSDPEHNQNYGPAVGIFYWLTLAEALIFLIERSYWEYQIGYRRLVTEVHHKLQLGNDQLENIKRFFYKIYSRCLKGSVFDGFDMSLVSYALDDIQENNAKEQLGGASILLGFLNWDDFSEKTLRRIGTKPGVIERLIEMLTWKENHEKEIRSVAAHILYHVSCQKSISYKIVAIAGGLENIVSLLTHDHKEEGEEEDGGGSKLQLQMVGLSILKRIATDHQNCVKIGNTGGLIPTLVSFIEIKDKSTELKEQRQPNKLKVLKKSLQLLRLLATTTGYPGKLLREDMVSVVYTLRNLRNILEHAECFPLLQELSLDILTSLALEDRGRESIGSTGGIIRNILHLFLKDTGISTTTTTPSGKKSPSQELRLAVKAGEALSVLALRSSANSHRICRRDQSTLRRIVSRLRDHPKIATRAAKILRNLCIYLDKEEIMVVAPVTPTVLRLVTTLVHGKELEAALGLAAVLLPYSRVTEVFGVGEGGEAERKALVERVVGVLCQPPPSHKLLRLRRYGVELTAALMAKDARFVHEFTACGAETELKKMLENVSDVENFYTFSGEFGLTRHSRTMEELVHVALHLFRQ